MLRAFMPLWLGAVCSVAVGAQAVAAPVTATAIAPSAVNCEQSTDLVSVPNSEAALLAQMEAGGSKSKRSQRWKHGGESGLRSVLQPQA